MRNVIIALLLFSSGCMEEKYTDKRPADQVGLISIARGWRDKVNAAGTNEGQRVQLLEKGVDAVKTHITDSLHLQFRSWEARVLDIAADPTEPDYIILSFGMNLDAGSLSEKTRYQSVVFTSRSSKSDPLYAKLKALKVGDIVHISGNFKTLQKTINMDSYNDLKRSKNVLDNPEFRIEIVDVEIDKS